MQTQQRESFWKSNPGALREEMLAIENESRTDLDEAANPPENERLNEDNGAAHEVVPAEAVDFTYEDVRQYMVELLGIDAEEVDREMVRLAAAYRLTTYDELMDAAE